MEDGRRKVDCNCSECVEFEGPNPKLMTAPVHRHHRADGSGSLRHGEGALVEGAQGVAGGGCAFLDRPRYLVCARCDGYGKNCYSLYLGRITSKYLPKVEGKERPGIAGILLEILALSTISNAPAVGMRRNRKLLALYMLLASLTLMGTFSSRVPALRRARHGLEEGVPVGQDVSQVLQLGRKRLPVKALQSQRGKWGLFP